MAQRIVALAQGNNVLSLGLTGVDVEQCTSVDEVEDRLSELMQGEAQVVIVDEYYRSRFSEFFQGRLSRHSGLPLIIYCPAFEDEDPGTEAYINSIVKPAVGFEIRLD